MFLVLVLSLITYKIWRWTTFDWFSFYTYKEWYRRFINIEMWYLNTFKIPAKCKSDSCTKGSVAFIYYNGKKSRLLHGSPLNIYLFHFCICFYNDTRNASARKMSTVWSSWFASYSLVIDGQTNIRANRRIDIRTDRRTDLGVSAIGSRFSFWVRNPKKT